MIAHHDQQILDQRADLDRRQGLWLVTRGIDLRGEDRVDPLKLLDHAGDALGVLAGAEPALQIGADHLNARQGVAQLVRQSGGDRADRRQTLRAGQLPILGQQRLGRLAHPPLQGLLAVVLLRLQLLEARDQRVVAIERGPCQLGGARSAAPLGTGW